MQHPSKTPHADPFRAFAAQPEAAGLYDPEQEKDACGLAAVATLRGPATHKIVQDALTALRALEHRGAVGADEGTGDGAGPGSGACNDSLSWASKPRAVQTFL